MPQVRCSGSRRDSISPSRHYLGIIYAIMRSMVLMGVLFSSLDAGVLASDTWRIEDSLLIKAQGGELMSLESDLEKEIAVDGDEINKDVKSTLDASGVQELQMTTSAFLELNKDGHVYTSNPAVFSYLKLPVEADLKMNQNLGSDVILSGPDVPDFDWDSSIQMTDPRDMIIGKFGKLSEIDKTKVLDEYVLSLDDLSKLEGQDFDKAVKDWFSKFCGISFGNIDIAGIEYKTGYDLPLTDSHNGVSCRWSESEEMSVRL